MICNEPETLAGVAARIDVSQERVRNWRSRTNRDVSTPKAFLEPCSTDSAGRDIWDGHEVDKWWSDHPKNPNRLIAAESVA